MKPPRRTLILAFVAAWVLLGPIAMTFGGCLLMGDCEALCGTVPVLHLAASLIAVALVCSSVWSVTPLAIPSAVIFVIEPPPRLLLPA